ncbi:MAG: RNA 3'-terminal phosphate cyclase [Candidatus Aenigmatarchaeota archaeon]
MPDIIEIDGSCLEAGGQIVRTAVGLSALTGKRCHIFNIRAGRPKPGLMAQHLTSVQAVAQICNARVEGASLWSKELTFVPGKIKSGEFSFDTGTAGAVSLVLQSLLVPATAAPGDIAFDVKGGTDVAWSPSMAYFSEILCYWLRKIGIEIKLEILKYGFYPAGGGRARVAISAARPSPLVALERGNPLAIRAISVASERLRRTNVAERQLAGCKAALSGATHLKVEEELHYVPTLSPGCSMHLFAGFANCRLGASSIGARGKPAEQVGREAAELLLRQISSGACVDRWAADQLLPFLAIAAERGPSKISVAEITNHCLTNIWVIEKFLPVKFEIEGEKGKAGVINCKMKNRG